MRILDVSPMGVNPPRRGSAVRTHNLLRHLSARHEVRQFSLAWDEPPPLRPRLDELRVEPTYSELRFHHPVAGAANRIGMHAWVNAPVLSGAALGLTRPTALDRLLRWADVVLVEFPWQFEYCRRRTDAPCVLASHNVEAVKFRSWAVPAGAALTRAPWVRHIERVESRAARSADLVLAVSGDEAAKYVGRDGAGGGHAPVPRRRRRRAVPDRARRGNQDQAARVHGVGAAGSRVRARRRRAGGPRRHRAAGGGRERGGPARRDRAPRRRPGACRPHRAGRARAGRAALRLAPDRAAARRGAHVDRRRGRRNAGPGSGVTLSIVMSPPQASHVSAGLASSPHSLCRRTSGGPSGPARWRSPQRISSTVAGKRSRPARVSRYS